MSFRILLILLVAVSFWGTGCNIINPEEGIPTYVHIDSFKFSSANSGLTGSNRQQITSVWAYLDGENVGVFDLPATIPVLMTSKRQLQLAPGVTDQGIKDYQLAYPMFSFYNIDIEPNPGKTINLQPETQYVPDLKFWIADFESGNPFSKLYGDTSIKRVTGQDSVFEGGGAGCISLNSTFKNAVTFAPISFTNIGTQGYLELHYKGTLSCQIAIMADVSEPNYLGGIKPKDSWGKYYINIQQYTTKYPNAQKFSVVIKTSLEDGQTDGYLLLDNIKVVAY